MAGARAETAHRVRRRPHARGSARVGSAGDAGGRATAVAALDVLVDPRQHHRDKRGEEQSPDLEEDEAQASDQTATHARTLASCMPGVGWRWPTPPIEA